jgi:hypothetical protein
LVILDLRKGGYTDRNVREIFPYTCNERGRWRVIYDKNNFTIYDEKT